ncbi:glycoside hydrolase family 9 protein [Pseudonocardia sp. S2-4]|uniref:Glycoside hydrolase family 9 protein n=1 Tax=Pseudonocardia humida TaxID=2800819 RepID=A0ABT0ZT94_9PSEU|nr:glycoside hydrolase family 9 protein [Pseudonocardia humida]
MSDEPGPVEFAVVDAGGATALRGRSRPWPRRPDPASGLVVHVLEFSALTRPGEYRIRAGAADSHPFRVDERVHDALAADALAFFRSMRCRHAGDVAVAAWTGPDQERLYPGWRMPGAVDVSGGWYDAGDYGKYVVSGAIAAWQLLAVADPAPPAPVLAECRWQLDWLLRMQVPAGDPLAGTAFHRVHGTTWSPRPGRPEDDPTERVLHRPSTTATLHLAAVAARGARAFAWRTRTTRPGCWPRPAPRTPPRTATPTCSPRTTAARSAAAPTPTTTPQTTSTGPRPSCTWPPGRPGSRRRSARRRGTPPTPSTPPGSTTTGSPPRPDSTWRSPRAGCPIATACAARSSRRPSGSSGSRPGSRGSSPTTRRRATTGAPPGAS